MKGRTLLEDVSKDKVLTAKVCRGSSVDEGVCVMVEDGDLDINQAILDKGFAERRFNKQARQVQ